MATSTKIDKSLTVDEIAYYYTLLNEPLTTYDCGILCKHNYGGIPYCCTTEHAVPLLYKSEFEYVKSLGDLWHEWKPVTAEDKEIKKSESKDQIFCECKGVEFCVRSERSISCRTFPLEPYIDRRGVFVGLTFIRDFTEKDPDTNKTKCPLTNRPSHIRQEGVDAHFIFWEKLMLRLKDEYELYTDTSKALRRERTRSGRKFKIFYPSHLKNIKSAQKYV